MILQLVAQSNFDQFFKQHSFESLLIWSRSPFSYWINNFGSDFKLNPEVRMQLLEFQNEVQIDIGNKAARLLDLEIW